MNYLYLFKSQNLPTYKIGVTKNIKQTTSKITTSYGVLNKEESIIYQCENRKLVDNIKNGTIAYLNNYFYSYHIQANGSTEWFKLESWDKCLSILNKYSLELLEFKKIQNLSEFLMIQPNSKNIILNITDSIEFMNKHSTIIENISLFIRDSKEQLIFKEKTNYFILSGVKTNSLDIENLPIYKWVEKTEQEILFNITEFNNWKKNGEHKEIRKLIEIKFFNKFTFMNLNQMFS